jgi:hypothetical protein
MNEPAAPFLKMGNVGIEGGKRLRRDPDEYAIPL